MAVPAGVRVLNHCETFTTTEGIHMARRRSLARVETPWCFFLDSDDELTGDAADVIDECISTGAPLAYTDEMVYTLGMSARRDSRAYTQVEHIARPLMLHHLVMMRTEAALDALDVIPAGELWVEMLLYFQIAKRGAVHLPRIGYRWHRGNGMHRARGILAAQARAAAWCARNKD